MADIGDKAEDMFDKANNKANELKGHAEQKGKDVSQDMQHEKDELSEKDNEQDK